MWCWAASFDWVEGVIGLCSSYSYDGRKDGAHKRIAASRKIAIVRTGVKTSEGVLWALHNVKPRIVPMTPAKRPITVIIASKSPNSTCLYEVLAPVEPNARDSKLIDSAERAQTHPQRPVRKRAR